MASKSSAIAVRISRSFGPAFHTVKAMVHAVPVDFIVHGIMVEGTPYKDSFYIRHLRLPLFRESRYLRLDYSPRISADDANRTDRFEGAADVVSELAVLRLRTTGIAERLHMPFGPLNFIAMCGHEELSASPQSRSLDLACCHALQGDLPKAVELIDRTLVEFLQAIEHQGGAERYAANVASLQELQSVFAKGEDAAREFLTIQAARAAHALGIQQP